MHPFYSKKLSIVNGILVGSQQSTLVNPLVEFVDDINKMEADIIGTNRLEVDTIIKGERDLDSEIVIFNL